MPLSQSCVVSTSNEQMLEVNKNVMDFVAASAPPDFHALTESAARASLEIERMIQRTQQLLTIANEVKRVAESAIKPVHAVGSAGAPPTTLEHQRAIFMQQHMQNRLAGAYSEAASGGGTKRPFTVSTDAVDLADDVNKRSRAEQQDKGGDGKSLKQYVAHCAFEAEPGVLAAPPLDPACVWHTSCTNVALLYTSRV